VARKLNDTANVMADLLKGMFGEAAGEKGAGHHVVLKLTRAGWEMTPEELAELNDSGVEAFVDSGAFSEVEFGPNGPTTVLPIEHEDHVVIHKGKKKTVPGWATRLEGMTHIASVLRERAYLVAPDKVGDQAETFERLKRYAPTVRKWRELGANVIVVLQKGELSALEFDAKCSEILGFDDYVRGIPSKKAAASPEEIGALVSGLPKGTRVHLLGLSPFGDNYDAVMAEIPEGYPLFCDSVRIRALVGRKNGPGGTRRILTKLRDEVAELLGFDPTTKLGPVESFLVKYRALCRYFETAYVPV